MDTFYTAKRKTQESILAFTEHLYESKYDDWERTVSVEEYLKEKKNRKKSICKMKKYLRIKG